MAAIIVAGEIRWGRLATKVAVDALIVDVELSTDVFGIFVREIGHWIWSAQNRDAKYSGNDFLPADKRDSEVDRLSRDSDVFAPMTDTSPVRLVPREGWHVLHIFFKIEHGQWTLLSAEEQREAKTNLTELVQEIRAAESTQLLIFSMVSPKADIGFMLLCADLHVANAFEKKLTLSLGPDVLTPVYSYLSLTEESEYVTSDAEYAETLQREQGLNAGSPDYEKAMGEFSARMKKYRKDKLYPLLPVWEVFCFYPMSKRRAPGQNWYALPFDERKKLMAGHARVGRKYHGRILQLITGSTGLDDAEWGVTLFAHDTFDIKAIVYEMRFDPVSSEYAEFGDFYIGVSVPLDELFRRVLL